jgi:DNA-binding MarR family transcriptional regulator
MTTERPTADPRIATFRCLREAYMALTKRLDGELEAATGLPLLWYGVLLFLERGPGGLRAMSELTESTAFTSGGVTRLVDRMEQAGYVERRPCPSDRRVHYVALTADGRAMLERATTVHLRGLQQHVYDVLAPAEVAQLDAMLARLATPATEGG